MWMVYLLALALGFVNVFGNPARQSLISELVPPELLLSLALMSADQMLRATRQKRERGQIRARG
jgi:hypothetical protein